MNKLIFVIPKEGMNKFSNYYNILEKKYSNIIKEAKLFFNRKNGIFVIEESKNMPLNHKKYCKDIIKKSNGKLIESKIIKQINLLENLTNKKIKLIESNDFSINLSTEALKNVSESLDMLKQNITIAIDKLQNINDGGESINKLKKLSSNINLSITNVAEIITNLSELQSKEGIINEDDSVDKGVVMDSEDALKNIDNVSKFVSSGQNVIIDDNLNKNNS